MTDHSLFIFRADSGHALGTGHLMRDLNFATELKQRSSQSSKIIFLTKAHPGNIIQSLQNRQNQPVDHWLILPTNPVREPIQNDSSTWLGDLARDDWEKCQKALNPILEETLQIYLIIDHYGIDQEWETLANQAIKPSKICVLDDMPNRKHFCHLLSDQTYRPFGHNPYQEKRLLSDKIQSEFALGPSYCLLNPVFHQFKTKNRTHKKKPLTINISFGGVDHHQLTYLTIRAIIDHLAKLQEQINYQILLGKLYPDREKLEKLIQRSQNTNNNPITNFQIYQNLDYPELIKLLTDADLAIGAGGVSLYERCCLGIPSIIFTLADNQIDNATNLSIAQAVTYLGSYQDFRPKKLTDSILSYLENDYQLLKIQQESCHQIIDGLGCQRLAKKLFS